MVLPTTIATVASALTIIDLTIKYANYLSPEVQQALNNGRKYIIAQNPNSLDELNNILIQTVYDTVPESLQDATSQDIKLALSLVAVFDNSITPEPPGRVPQYGKGIIRVIDKVIDNLESWGCFSAWGENIEMFIGGMATVHLDSNNKIVKIDQPPGYSYSIRILPAVRSGKNFRRCKKLMKILPRSIKKWKMYFLLDRSYSENPHYVVFSSGKKLSSATLEAISFLKGRSAYELLVEGNGNKFDSFENSYQLNYEEVGFILSGLLADFIEYSRRVRGEEFAGRSLVDNLRNLFNPD